MIESSSKATTVTHNTALRDSLAFINSAICKVVFVESSDKTVVGSLTDGDVRRALLDGKSLDCPVSVIMNKDFLFSYIKPDYSTLSKSMSRKKIQIAPILTDDHRLDSLFIINPAAVVDSFSKRENPVVIMAGGKGSRLSPITDDCPKPMLNLGGKPMLETILDRFISSGFTNFFFSVNYLKNQIIDYFGDGENWGVSINYLIEDEPLGTAGSLSLLPLSTETLIVTNCDVITDVDYSNLLHFHHMQKSDATICVREHHTRLPFGIITSQGPKLISIQEKPLLSHFVNTGIYLLEPKCISHVLPNSFVDMPDLFQSLLKLSYNVCSCPVHEYWLDVGRHESLQQARSDFSS